MDVVYQELVPEHRRLAVVERLFGIDFPMRIEPTVFAMAGRLCPDYTGGYWRFFELSNGGFFMAPDADVDFRVYCENGFDGSLSAEAFGITVCLYAFSHLSFTKSEAAEACGCHYHLLREHMLDHREAQLILGAID